MINSHSPERGLSFGDALNALCNGHKVSRTGWNGKDMYLKLQVPDENSKMKRPYIYIVPGPEWVVPWTASQADLLAIDWQIV